MKLFYSLPAKFFASIHTYSYKLMAKFAIVAEGGIHPKHRLMKYHEFFENNISKENNVLDIGCGNGALSFDVAKKAKSVLGIDIKKKNIAIAKKKFNGINIKYVVGNALNYNFQENYNVVILSNVLEHLKDRNIFLEKMITIAPKLLIRVPMIDRDWSVLYKKELGIQWKTDKTHELEYTEEYFIKELKCSGLKISNSYIRFGEIYAVVESA